MSDKTGIEWTDATWNPLTGCTKVSPGCDHCYAKTMHERFNGPGSFDTVTLAPQRLDQPLRWRRPRRVFVNSMSDLFHKDVPDKYIAQVFAVMALAQQHTFQLLTKRHGRMRSLLSSPLFRRQMYDALVALDYTWINANPVPWPLPNVWLGVSVEDQARANLRIPALLDTPAAVRWLSCEPLLGPVDLIGGLCEKCWGDPPHFATCDRCHDRLWLRELDWVVVGGESGQGARPMQPAWARSLRDQCASVVVPFLFKQWGAHAPTWVGDDPAVMVRVGKKAAGRELDGVTHDGYPT